MELMQMHELTYIHFQIIALCFKVGPSKMKKSKTLKCGKEIILYKQQKKNWCWYFSTLLFQKWVEHPCGQKFPVGFCMKCISCTLHFEVSVLLFKMLLMQVVHESALDNSVALKTVFCYKSVFTNESIFNYRRSTWLRQQLQPARDQHSTDIIAVSPYWLYFGSLILEGKRQILHIIVYIVMLHFLAVGGWE